LSGQIETIAPGATGAASKYCMSSSDGVAVAASTTATIGANYKVDHCAGTETCNSKTTGATADGTDEKALCITSTKILADTKTAATGKLICMKTGAEARKCTVGQACTVKDGFCDGSLAPGGPNPFTALLAVALAA